MKPLQLALLSLSRRKASTAVAVVSIALSVAASGLLLRLDWLSSARFATMAGGYDAIVGAKAGGIEILLGSLNGEGPYPDFLPQKLFETLESQQTVHFEDGANERPSTLRSIVPLLYFATYKNHRVAGTNPNFLNRPEPHDAIRVLAGAWPTGPQELLLGAQVAAQDDLHVGSEVAITPWFPSTVPPAAPLTFKVAGVLEGKGNIWDQMLFTTVEQAQRVLHTAGPDIGGKSIWHENVLQYFLMNLGPGGMASLEALINRRSVGQIISVAEQKHRLEELTGTGQQLGLFMAVLIMVLGALGVAAMLMARFDGMTLQLAVLRALGYGKSEIGRWLLWEGFLLGVGACFVGAVIDAIGFPIVRGLLGSALPGSDFIQVPLYQSAPVWCGAILATTAAVFVPLLRIYQQDVHRTLRS
jgi:putative ABC transport system permease protein